MSRHRLARRVRPALVGGTLLLFGLGAAVSYGVAQNTVVTHAEWVVYMVQALGLDWNLPPNAKTRDYLARLNWTTSIDFQADQPLAGSSASLVKEGEGAQTYVRSTTPPGEALYRFATLQQGDYNLRVRMAGGSAALRMGSAVFEMEQPTEGFEWVDLERVNLTPGSHDLNVLIGDGTRVQALAVTPPCLRPVEPIGGWQPLEPLHFGELAVSVARALNLEHKLPALGPEITVKGEGFIRMLELPTGETGGTPESPEPFWLSSGHAVLTARARFSVPEAGLYSMEARYISPTHPVRWIVNRCLKAVSCPAAADAGVRWIEVVALDLAAGEHELEVTLPPQARLDRIVIQRREATIDSYLKAVEDEGFNLSAPAEEVRRRQALDSAQRLRRRFQNSLKANCADALMALELELGAAWARTAGKLGPQAPQASEVPGLPPSTGQNEPLFPKGGTEPPVASPTTPSSGQ